MRTFLVTGGAGFIGSHIAEALARRGDRVRALDNLSTGHRANLKPCGDALEFIEADQRPARGLTWPMPLQPICLGVGYCLLEVSDVLGKMIMSAALSLMFIDRVGKHSEDVRVQQAIDSRLEAEYLAEGVRRRF